jgi:hypothetical protein
MTTPQTTEPCSPAIEAAMDELELDSEEYGRRMYQESFSGRELDASRDTLIKSRTALRSAINAEIAAALKNAFIASDLWPTTPRTTLTPEDASALVILVEQSDWNMKFLLAHEKDALNKLRLIESGGPRADTD